MEGRAATVGRLAEEAAGYWDAEKKSVTIEMPGTMISLRAVIGPRPPEVLVRKALDSGFLPALLGCFKLRLELESGGLGTARTLVALFSTFVPLIHTQATTERHDALVGTLLDMCERVQTQDTLTQRNASAQITAIAGWREAPIEFIEFALATIGRAAELLNSVAAEVMASTYLMSLVMSDHEAVVSAALMLLLKVRDGAKSVFVAANLERLAEISEECCYYLVEGNVTDVDAAVCLKLLGTLWTAKPLLAAQVFGKYRGLHDELTSRWQGHDFADDLNTVIGLLDLQREAIRRQEQVADMTVAVSKIYAWYSGCLTRRRFAALQRGIVAFQSAWRRRLAEKEAARLKTKASEATDWDAQEARLKARIESKLAEMRRIHALPPHKVPGHLESREGAAAVTIQRVWRGHKTRQKFPGLPGYLKGKERSPQWATEVKLSRNVRHNAAATLIQRSYRDHRRRKLTQASGRSTTVDLLPGLDEARRTELREQLRWELSPRGIPLPPKTQTEAQAAHTKGQSCYSRAVNSRQTAANLTAQRSDLIARMVALRNQVRRDLALDINELATNASHGDVARGLLLDPSIPKEAAERHRAKLKSRGTPWWARADGEGAGWEPGLAEMPEEHARLDGTRTFRPGPLL